MMLGCRSRATASASTRKRDEVVGPRLAAAADHLQGDQAVQPEVPRLVDDPHAPFAQPLEDVVAGDGWPVRGSRLPPGLSCLRRGPGKPWPSGRGRPTSASSAASSSSVLPPWLRLGSGGEVRAIPGPGPASSAASSQAHLATSGRRGLVRDRPVGLVSTRITGDDLGPGKIDRLRGVGSHRLDRRSFSRRGATRRQPLEVFLTDDAVLDVRQDPGVVRRH